MRTEFFTFRKRAQIAHSLHLLLYYAVAPQAKLTGRSGVVIPKKVSKLATSRNTLRRQLIDAMFPLAKSNNIDLILFVKSMAPVDVLFSELNQLVQAAHV